MSAADELRGWKEIAAHLGKSVRAAQRWEQDLGLPVRRIRTAVGHAIYARKSEIDEWLRHQESSGPLPAAHNHSDPQEQDEAAKQGNPAAASSLIPEPPPPVVRRPLDGREGRIRVPVGVWLVAAGLGVALAALGWLSVQGGRRIPASHTFKGDSLVALDGAGQEVWRYRFSKRIGDVTSEIGEGGATPVPSRRVRPGDVDGDGTDELLVMVKFTEPSQHPSDAIFCFSADGRLRWSYEPADTLEFEGGTFSSPWTVTDWTIGETDRGRAVYVAINHSIWWPSMIVRIEPDGRSERLFTQSGGLYSLRWWKPGEQPYLVAAGINNEHHGASLAVIDPTAGPSTSPQSATAAYHCRECPRRGPVRYFVVPGSDVTIASGSPYNRGSGLGVDQAAISLFVQEDLRSTDAQRVFSLSKDLEIERAVAVDYFWARHDHFERNQLLDHPSDSCPHRNDPTPIRRWTESEGWRRIAVGPAAPRLAAGRAPTDSARP